MDKSKHQPEIKRRIFAIGTKQLFSRTPFTLCIACAPSNSVHNIIIASHYNTLMLLLKSLLLNLVQVLVAATHLTLYFVATLRYLVTSD